MVYAAHLKEIVASARVFFLLPHKGVISRDERCIDVLMPDLL